jgi:cobalamin-dependent methionine synthase I
MSAGAARQLLIFKRNIKSEKVRGQLIKGNVVLATVKGDVH